MKMKLFYLVRKYTEKDEYEDMDCRFVAGPFPSMNDAWETKQQYLRDRYYLYGQYEVVQQIVEVE